MQRYKYYIGRSDIMKNSLTDFKSLKHLKMNITAIHLPSLCFTAEEESGKQNS